MKNFLCAFWRSAIVLALAVATAESETAASENAVISSSPSFLPSPSPEETSTINSNIEIAATTTTFGSFLEKHVFQPTTNCLVLTERPQDFGVGEWNVWLQDRLWDYGKATRKMTSVVIGSRYEMVNTFRSLIKYINSKPQPTKYWSEEKFPMYLFQWNSSFELYDAFECPEMYFVATLDNTTSTPKPIHFDGQQETYIENELTIPWNSCRQLQSSSQNIRANAGILFVVSIFLAWSRNI